VDKFIFEDLGLVDCTTEHQSYCFFSISKQCTASIFKGHGFLDCYYSLQMEAVHCFEMLRNKTSNICITQHWGVFMYPLL